MGNTKKNQSETAPKTQAERFAEVRETFKTKEEFRASIAGENVKTLRDSAKEFEINLQGRDSKDDILDTIADTVYADGGEGGNQTQGGDGTGNPNESPGPDETPAEKKNGEGDMGQGDKPTPAHDEKTDSQNAKAAEKGKDKQPSAAALKRNADSSTESAEAATGEAGTVIRTESAHNPNENWTEPNEEKKQTLSARALHQKEMAASQK